jgi:hypothetical protein
MSDFLNSGLSEKEYFQCAKKYEYGELIKMSDENEMSFQNKVLNAKLKKFIKGEKRDKELYSELKFIISLIVCIDEENSNILTELNDDVLNEISSNY